MNSIVTASLRRVLGRNTLLDVLSADRERIMASIMELVNAEMQNFGVAKTSTNGFFAASTSATDVS